MVRFGAMHSAPIFRPGLSGLGRLAALGSRHSAGVLTHPRLWGIGTCCRRSWGLTAASLGPLGPHIAPWSWYRQRGRSIRISLRLPLVAAVCLPGCRRAGAGCHVKTHTPFTVRRGPAFTPLSPTPESALMLLVFTLVFRIRRTAALRMRANPARGAPGSNRPAAYPLRPMMGGVNPARLNRPGRPGGSVPLFSARVPPGCTKDTFCCTPRTPGRILCPAETRSGTALLLVPFHPPPLS